jgi:hypothetical protein
MTEKDNVIQVYLTCKDVSDKTGTNRYVINNGIDHLTDVAQKLLLNNKDVIYVHLSNPIQRSDANSYLARTCQSLIDSGRVQYAVCGPLGMPDSGTAIHTVFDTDDNLIEDRYMIVYRK